VERLIRVNGWQGMVRARKVRTTVPDPAADRAPDLVDRQFRVPAPNHLLVADFTYVPTATGVFAYTAVVIDAHAGADRRLGMLDVEADDVRRVRDRAGRGLPTA